MAEPVAQGPGLCPRAWMLTRSILAEANAADACSIAAEPGFQVEGLR